MYAFGAYWFWIPPRRSSTRGSGSFTRSSRSWRASSARFRSRWPRVRSATGATLAERPGGGVRCASAMPPTTSAAPRASQAVTGSSSTSAPMTTASGEIAYAYVTARVGPRPRRPTFQRM